MTHDFITIDAKITALLRDRNGRPLANAEIARHFAMEPKHCITVINRLIRAGVVRPDRSRTQTTYYVPTAAQQAKLDAAADAIPQSRAFRPYVVPQPMQDILARIRAERDAIPSHYGQAA